MSSGQQRRRFTTWLVAFATLFAYSGLPDYLARAQAAQPSELERVLDQLERAFDALEAAAAEIPRDTFDPEAVLDLAGYEAEEVFVWVRDNTYLVPYRGALRGPVGVLMDRVGNSLDRALLLNELLQLLGYETRLARAELSFDQAAVMFSGVGPVPEGGALADRSPGTDEVIADLERYITEYGLDADLLRQQLERTQTENERLQVDARRRVEEQTAFLLDKIGPPSQEVLDRQGERQITALQDHWWVQLNDGADWVDLDASLPDMELGVALTEAGETRQISDLGELPDDLVHALTIRVVLECRRGDALEETTLLESERLLPATLLGAPLVLQHIPVDWPQDLDLFRADDPEALLKTTMLTQDRWVPSLRIGSQVLLDLSYSEDCRFDPAIEVLSAVGRLGGALTEGVGGLADTIGGIGEAGPDSTGDVESGRVTAQWIEYIIHTPGESPRTIRRQIFDLIDSADRQTPVDLAADRSEASHLSWRLALIGQTDILVLPHRLSLDFSDLVSTTSLIAKRNDVLALVRSVDEGDGEAFADRANDVKSTLPDRLHALSQLRWGLSDQLQSVFIDRINILSHHTQLRADQSDRVQRIEAYDIVENAVAATGRVDAGSWSASVRQGVMDTNTEALLATAACEAAQPPEPCLQRGNAAAALLASESQGIDWVVVRSPAELDTFGAALPPNVQRKIEQDLNQGTFVLMPEQAVLIEGRPTTTWWTVSPDTGQTLGKIETGWGGNLVEYTLLVGRSLLALACFYSAASDIKLVGSLVCFAGVTGGGSLGVSIFRAIFYGAIKILILAADPGFGPLFR